MRARTLAPAAAIFTLSAMPLHAQQVPALAPLTVAEAVARAQAANPALRAKQAQLAAEDGALRDARAILYNNPQLYAEVARRSAPAAAGPQERVREWAGGVSQTFETGGQPAFRREAAGAARDALAHEIEFAQRQARAAASAAFYRVLALQQRVEVETQAARLFEEAAAAVRKRREAGEDTKLDSNVALVEAERARNQLALAREQLVDSRVELAAIVQLDAGTLPLAQGELALGPAPPPLERLLSDLQAHPRLLALRERSRSAQARLGLQKALRAPDITLGLGTGREGPPGARERITLLTATVPLPVFRRNAAGIGQAATEAAQAQLEYETALRDSRAATLALWAKSHSQEERVRRLLETVVPALSENLDLSLRSRQAGQIGLLEQIVVSRQALDARRDLIDAFIEYHATRAGLEQGVTVQSPGKTP